MRKIKLMTIVGNLLDNLPQKLNVNGAVILKFLAVLKL